MSADFFHVCIVTQGFRIFLSGYFGTDRIIVIFLCVPKKRTEKFVFHRNIQVSSSDATNLISKAFCNFRATHCKRGCIACATALMRTSFLAHDNIFSFQPWMCCHTRSLRYAEVLPFDRLTWAGRPRYLSFRVSFSICNFCFTSSLLVEFAFALNNIVDLPLLITCLEHCSYKSRISCKCAASSFFARMRVRESLAKSKWETLGASRQILTHAISPLP